MTQYPPGARAIGTGIERALRRLIEALDRRVPHADRSGEAGIALEAAALRRAATDRLQTIGEGRRAACREVERAHAVMTDDGAPPPVRLVRG